MIPKLTSDAASFPVEPPADLDDAQTIVEHDWQSFATVERMVNHWDRPGWYEGRRAYYWMLTFGGHRELGDLVQRCQEEITPLGLDLVPFDGLHVTLARIGDASKVSPSAIDVLADHAAKGTEPPFRLHAHPLAGSRGALRLSLTPWAPLVRLHAALTEINASVGVPGGKPTSGFRPHMGVAYNNRERPAAPMVEVAATLRQLLPVALDVSTVEVVELQRTDRAYRIRLLHRIPLK
ncbi:2'-5' RNA ligase family protein [Streptomyces sp. NPDC048172]|uniref:2'-5' RNA ligase family protein n=1 Tax=Streptomyces sp. NPDC048172 TaxID=3365505 RepID=UPI003718228D